MNELHSSEKLNREHCHKSEICCIAYRSTTKLQKYIDEKIRFHSCIRQTLPLKRVQYLVLGFINDKRIGLC